MHRERRGMALLASLVLLTLSAALATATFAAASAMRRAALSTRVRARVEAETRRAFAEVLASWDAALDSMPVGAVLPVPLATEPAGAGPALVRTARVDRVAEGLYTLTVDIRAFTRDHPLARRRAQLWLQRGPAPAPGAPGGAPSVVTPWGVVDLY